MSLSQTIVAPSCVGPFIFRGTVGSGAFSVVKLSFHTELKQFFACKIVPRNRINSPDLEQRFEMEIRINQQMHHPGVVQIVDLLKDDMNYYIFMEFCPNGELFKYIVDKTRLTESEAAHFMYQFLDALNYVHSLGVAHRDLKPENLLLDPTGRLKISDFGLSKFVGNSGIVSTPCGSPCYASPECLSGTSYNGQISDIWSIGVIMYAMVTGQLPWTKRNQAQLFNQIKKGEYSIPQYLSEDCRDLLSRLMTVDISQRITLEDALSHPWIKKAENADMSEFQNNFFTIVSLKKVDEFFESNACADATIDQNKIERTSSQKEFNFSSTVKAIMSKNVFPTIGMNRARGQTFSQSLKIENTKMLNPQISGNQNVPSASFGNIPNAQASASLTFSSAPKRFSSLTTQNAKVLVPKKPMSTWSSLK